MPIPFFDGHNDTLLKLLEFGPGAEQRFIDGSSSVHIDLPRARSAGMAGGFFAMFPPPLKGASATIVPTGSIPRLPPELDIAEARRTISIRAAPKPKPAVKPAGGRRRGESRYPQDGAGRTVGSAHPA